MLFFLARRRTEVSWAGGLFFQKQLKSKWGERKVILYNRMPRGQELKRYWLPETLYTSRMQHRPPGKLFMSLDYMINQSLAWSNCNNNTSHSRTTPNKGPVQTQMTNRCTTAMIFGYLDTTAIRLHCLFQNGNCLGWPDWQSTERNW